MIILAIEFPDGTPINIAKGANPVSVSDGTNTIPGGKLSYLIDGVDPDVAPAIHTHPISGSVSGTTGPPA